MLNLIISPVELEINKEDLYVLGRLTKGKHSGKILYANTSWLFSRELEFLSPEKTERTENLNMLKNEIGKTENLDEVFSSWFSYYQILDLNEEEAEEFMGFYSLREDPDLLSTLAEVKFKNGKSLGVRMFMNSIDLLITKVREDKNNQKEGDY